MGLFNKNKGKDKKDQTDDVLRRLTDKLNEDFSSKLTVYKCPNGCIDSIVIDKTEARWANAVPKCPKCGSRAILT